MPKSLSKHQRRRTRPVMVGGVEIGGDAPIRVQSMLTSSPHDLEKVFAEIPPLIEAGCELIRLTVPTQRDCDALPNIVQFMRNQDYTVPLISDIHFNPRLAIQSAEFVEKVRINPGNYADQKKFKLRNYSQSEYQHELERIEQSFTPLIKALQKHRRALRIGVNHGSLSDRIMGFYGDTPQGMVEAALEYLRIARKHRFEDIIISMKASNPLVVIEAYRLLVAGLDAESMDYPLHIGVTEAGNGLAGRVKSAIGIGALLHEGLGDTIRVSLTEPAQNELPVCYELLENLKQVSELSILSQQIASELSFSARQTKAIKIEGLNGSSCLVGGDNQVALLAHLANPTLHRTDNSYDLALGSHQNAKLTIIDANDGNTEQLKHRALAIMQAGSEQLIILNALHPLHAYRQLVGLAKLYNWPYPMGLMLPPQVNKVGWAAEFGALAMDKLIDALLVYHLSWEGSEPSDLELAQTALQSSRLRAYRAEFISCPSCGRTLFDLESTTERIRRHTQHLRGVRIGVMGCIVNGPGEMADADFGYVGGAAGKINLYRKQECVVRGIPEEEAVERLISLIKQYGLWTEPNLSPE